MRTSLPSGSIKSIVEVKSLSDDPRAASQRLFVTLIFNKAQTSAPYARSGKINLPSRSVG